MEDAAASDHSRISVWFSSRKDGVQEVVKRGLPCCSHACDGSVYHGAVGPVRPMSVCCGNLILKKNILNKVR